MTIPRAAVPPHLLWVNHFAVAPDMGGPTRHAEMGRELARRGWSVTVAASDYHLHRRAYMRRAPDDRRAVHERIDGVDFAWLWASPYTANDLRRVGNWLSFSRALLELPLPEPPRIVIGSTPHLLAALAAWRIARRHRAPFVLEVRDLWPETLAVAGRRKGAGYLGMWMLARHLYAVASRIIVLAEGTASYLARHGVPEHKLVFVPNGIDAARFIAPEVAGGDACRLVYAGAHGPANGLDAVLDAAELLRARTDIRFVLVGDGPAKAQLVASAQARGLHNIEFRDPIPKPEMPAFLASCDAGLMVLKDVPVFAFGVSPNKLFDYWGAGLPVVCNVAGEVASPVAACDGGIQAASASGRALADAVLAIADRSAAERRAMGRRGREWVVEERDRARLAGRLEDVLVSLRPEVAA